MKRKLLAALLLLAMLTGCAGQNLPSNSEKEISFIDDTGEEITIVHPRRVAVLLGSFAQVWQLAGGEVVAAPGDAWDDLNLDMPDTAVNLGATKNLNLELLLASRPDLVLASTNTRQNVEWRDTLSAAGIPTAYFDIDNFGDYCRLLDICTDITGRKDLYEEHALAVQEQIDSVLAHSTERLAHSEPPTVLCMVASASAVYAKNSRGNVLGAMLKELGCVNLADSDAMLLEQLSLEHVLLSDPDMIFFVQRGDDEEGMRAYVQQHLMEHPIWNRLSAVQEGRVYFMEKNLFNLKPNHRWGEAYEILEEILSGG